MANESQVYYKWHYEIHVSMPPVLRFPLKIIIKPWHEMMKMVLQNTCFNAVGVTLLIAQGCQTIVQATLG